MSSVSNMILHLGSTIKVSTELPVATRHRRDMTHTQREREREREQTHLD